jgi:uncharacterized protein (TIGR02996 family)
MNPEEAFEREILDHPFDDTCRLIYAAWLEERVDERGELLRLQHNLRRMTVGESKVRGLKSPSETEITAPKACQRRF